LKKAKKVFFSILLSALMIVVIAVIAFFSGAFVKPTDYKLSQSTEIKRFDRLEQQFEIEKTISQEYESMAYTPDNPLIIVDPYEMNPLSALLIFKMETDGIASLEVEGKTSHSHLQYTVKNKAPRYEIPILGLYPDMDNHVKLSISYGDGVVEHYAYIIKTEPLPVDFQSYQTVVSRPELMEPGWTMMVACFSHSYTCLLDPEGDIRGYFTNREMAHGSPVIRLENGHLLLTGDEYRQVPYHKTSLWEINWLGKIFREYEVVNGVHHDIRELPNGDILAVSNNKEMFRTGTREDVVIVIDRETGIVKQEYDFRGILDEQREPVHHFHPNILNPPNVDWMHANAAVFDERDNTIIVSSPIQSMIVKINAITSEIIWILGPHEGYDGPFQRFQKYLIQPFGENFEWFWCQHAPEILPDLDQNPDTLDLLVFDNGQNRSFYEENVIAPIDNYSRAVHYRIDEKNKTVRQIWQYGKELGSGYYASFLGDVDSLPITGNRLITFGGQLYDGDIPCEDIVSGVFGQMVTRSRVVEVTSAGEPVFEIAARENDYTVSAETYQAERIILSEMESETYLIGEKCAERIGEQEICGQSTEINAPLLYTKRLTMDFAKCYREQNRLVIDGQLRYDGKSYLIGKAYIILRSKKNAYVFNTNGGMNGRVFSSIDLSELPEDEYLLSVAGIVREGNDAASGALLKGHYLTPYKVTIVAADFTQVR
jgi:arylsulfate sulfotransferase